VGFPEFFRGIEPYRHRLRMPQGFGAPESEDFGDEEGDYFGPMYAAAFGGGLPDMPRVLEGSFGKEALRPQAVAAEKSLQRRSLALYTVPPAPPEAPSPLVPRHTPIPEAKPETAKPIAPPIAPPERPAPQVPVIPVGPVVVPSPVPKVEGLSFRTDWKWGGTDVSQVPREYMMLNEVAINGVVRAMKDKTNIPGIRVYPEQVAVKSRR